MLLSPPPCCPANLDQDNEGSGSVNCGLIEQFGLGKTDFTPIGLGGTPFFEDQITDVVFAGPGRWNVADGLSPLVPASAGLHSE